MSANLQHEWFRPISFAWHLGLDECSALDHSQAVYLDIGLRQGWTSHGLWIPGGRTPQALQAARCWHRVAVFLHGVVFHQLLQSSARVELPSMHRFCARARQHGYRPSSGAFELGVW